MNKIKQLDYILKPKSIAVIGASRRAEAVGHGVFVSLLKGGVFKSKYTRPFKGKVYPINPKAERILGVKCYPSVNDIKAERMCTKED